MQSPNLDKLKTHLGTAAITVGITMLLYSAVRPRQPKEPERDTYVPYNSDIYCQHGTGYFTIDSVTSTWFDASGLNIKTVSRQYKLPWYCTSMRPIAQPRTDHIN